MSGVLCKKQHIGVYGQKKHQASQACGRATPCLAWYSPGMRGRGSASRKHTRGVMAGPKRKRSRDAGASCYNERIPSSYASFLERDGTIRSTFHRAFSSISYAQSSLSTAGCVTSASTTRQGVFTFYKDPRILVLPQGKPPLDTVKYNLSRHPYQGGMGLVEKSKR